MCCERRTFRHMPVDRASYRLPADRSGLLLDEFERSAQAPENNRAANADARADTFTIFDVMHGAAADNCLTFTAAVRILTRIHFHELRTEPRQ